MKADKKQGTEKLRDWSIKNPTQRIASIVTELQKELGRTVDSDFCEDLERLSLDIKSHGALLKTEDVSERRKFGRRNLWSYVADYIDGHFAQVIEIYQLLTKSQEHIRLPSEQLKSDFSFEYWHSKVKDAVDKLESEELTFASQKLDAIRLIMSCMNTTHIQREIHYCRYCYRRVPTKNNCRHHMAKSHDFYLEIKKPSRFINSETWNWITRQRGIRGLVGEYPFNHSFFRESGKIPNLIHQGSWSYASRLLQRLFDTELNTLRGVLVLKMYEEKRISLFPLDVSFPNYPAFRKWLYSEQVLDNTHEDSFSAFWLMNTLFAANETLRAEKELEECTKRSEESMNKRNSDILRLHAGGQSYRSIAKTLGISKSLVGKIVAISNTSSYPS